MEHKMFKFIIALSGSAAVAIAGPALAQDRGGHGQGGAAAGMHSQGPANASPNGMNHASPNSILNRDSMSTATGSIMGNQDRTGTSYNPNSPAAQRSQGPAHASPNGMMHANENSVLARGAVSATQLEGLNTGLTVQDSTGATVGTVSQVITGPNNTIRGVVVTSSTGQTFTLAPSSLTISGSVVTTTSTMTTTGG
jgi:hypothetical protein